MKIICDKCGKEITKFIRHLDGTLTENWSIENGSASYEDDIDFEGYEQTNLQCGHCNAYVNSDVYQQIDNIMF